MRDVTFLYPDVADARSTSEVIDYWPFFSPRGDRLCFSRSLDSGKSWRLFVVASPALPAKRFGGTGPPISASRGDWSTANGLIAFTGTSTRGTNGSWLMREDGSDCRAVAASGLSDQTFYPSWYPDGQHLAVSDLRSYQVRRIDLRTAESVAITDNSKVLAGMSRVSPDGTFLAFAGQANAGQTYDQRNNVIWLLHEDGSIRTLEDSPGQGRTPSWSPDGRRLAFESNRGSADGRYAAFVIDLDGSRLTQVTPYEFNANHPTWSPDGQRLVFSSRRLPDGRETSIASTAID